MYLKLDKEVRNSFKEENAFFKLFRKPWIKKILVLLMSIFVIGLLIVNVVGTLSSYEYLVDKMNKMDSKLQNDNLTPLRYYSDYQGIKLYTTSSDMKNKKRGMNVIVDPEVPLNPLGKDINKAEIFIPSINLSDNSLELYCDSDNSNGQKFKVQADIYDEGTSVYECINHGGKVVHKNSVSTSITSTEIQTSTDPNDTTTKNEAEKTTYEVTTEINTTSVENTVSNPTTTSVSTSTSDSNNKKASDDIHSFDNSSQENLVEFIKTYKNMTITDPSRKEELNNVYIYLLNEYAYENSTPISKYSVYDFSNWRTFIPKEYFNSISKKGIELYKNKKLGIFHSGTINDFKDTVGIFYSGQYKNGESTLEHIEYKNMGFSKSSFDISKCIIRRMIFPLNDRCFIIKGYTVDHIKFYNSDGERVLFVRCPNSWCNFKYSFYSDDDIIRVIKENYFVEFPWPSDITLFNENKFVTNDPGNTMIIGDHHRPQIILRDSVKIKDFYADVIDCHYQSFTTIKDICNQELECFYHQDNTINLMHDQFYNKASQPINCKYHGDVIADNWRFSFIRKQNEASNANEFIQENDVILDQN